MHKYDEDYGVWFYFDTLDELEAVLHGLALIEEQTEPYYDNDKKYTDDLIKELVKIDDELREAE